MELNEEQTDSASKAAHEEARATKITASQQIVHHAVGVCNAMGIGPAAMIEVLCAATCAGTVVVAKDGHEGDALDGMMVLMQGRVDHLKVVLAEGADHA